MQNNRKTSKFKTNDLKSQKKKINRQQKKMNKAKSWFLEKTSKNDKLAILLKKKKENKNNQQQNEEIPIGPVGIKMLRNI